MDPSILPANVLTDRSLALWSEIQRSDQTLLSPFFRPEFTQAVASVRRDVYVAELKDNGQTVGFFPFCKGRMGIGRPVGQPLCDFQGIIGRTDRSWNDVELICRCGLAAWDFDHLLCSQAMFNSRQHRPEESLLIDMSDGFISYRRDKQGQGTNLFRDMDRKARKMGREIGPLRFELNASDPSLLRTVIQWKSEQSRRAGTFDVFRWNWPQRLLESILAHRGEAFGGVLSVLWAGETVAAIHMGMRSGSVLHWWFPTYNRVLAKYSPGQILLLYVLRGAEEIGIKRVDLGKGDELYKRRFMTGSEMVAVGSIESSRITRMIRKARRTSAAFVRSSPLPHSFRRATRLVRFGEKWLKYR